MLVLLVEFDRLFIVEPTDLAVYANADEAVRAQLIEDLCELALATTHDRREHEKLGAFFEIKHAVDDLLGRLGLDLLAAVVAIRMPDARPKQSQVVVDLGDRADGRSRVA